MELYLRHLSDEMRVAEMDKHQENVPQYQDYKAFLDDAKDLPNHYNRLNNRLARLVLPYCTLSRSTSATGPLVQRACSFLRRLPRFPPAPYTGPNPWLRQMSLPGALPLDYVLPGLEPHLWIQRPELEFTSFTKLKVVSRIDDATMLFALVLANSIDLSADLSLGLPIKRCLDLLVKLLNYAFDEDITYRHTRTIDSNANATAVVATLLWTAWHRSATIYLAWVLQHEMAAGPSNENLLALTYPSVLQAQRLRQKLDDLFSVTEYICPWALELLQTSKASLAFDYRSLFSRFREAHPNSEPRCKESKKRCSGESPELCGRFSNENLRLPEGSVHDGSCSRCLSVKWDERSYRQTTGGRAVDIYKSSNRAIYRTADADTLAITHVWAHGQGGRPHTGFNKCLHERYVNLAKLHSCKSYWIDTLCIPDAHDIRKEAIAHINPTFSESKITLVCDRDIMSLQKPSGPTLVAQAERLLATLLVCDWSVRAWTTFESIRGRRNLHLLCADNEVVSLRELIKRVLYYGAVDLAVLALAVKHSLPSKTAYRMSIMEASALLSHRHATRSGDDILIWSLMSRQSSMTADPKGFWALSVGRYLNTGYLMSAAPRLEGVKYFSWAPCSPNVGGIHGLINSDGLAYSSDGEGSEVGRITEKGLEAIWLIYLIQAEDDGDFMRGVYDPNPCWEAVKELRQKHRRVCLLMPKSLQRGEYSGAEETKRRNKLVAVGYSNAADARPLVTKTGEIEDQWTWGGVHEWPRAVARPAFDWESILLM